MKSGEEKNLIKIREKKSSYLHHYTCVCMFHFLYCEPQRDRVNEKHKQFFLSLNSKYIQMCSKVHPSVNKNEAGLGDLEFVEYSFA